MLSGAPRPTALTHPLLQGVAVLWRCGLGGKLPLQVCSVPKIPGRGRFTRCRFRDAGPSRSLSGEPLGSAAPRHTVIIMGTSVLRILDVQDLLT